MNDLLADSLRQNKVFVPQVFARDEFKMNRSLVIL